MLGWGVFFFNKRCSTLKKIPVKLIYSIKTNFITSFLSKFLVTLLRNSIKYVVFKAASGALSGALKVSLLRTLTVTAYYKIIPENQDKNEYATLKIMG